jgi:hypothetical protein
VDGNTLTGETTSNNFGKSMIENGKVDGDNVSFTITVSMGGNDAKVEYKGKVVDADSIKFEVSVAGLRPDHRTCRHARPLNPKDPALDRFGRRAAEENSHVAGGNLRRRTSFRSNDNGRKVHCWHWRRHRIIAAHGPRSAGSCCVLCPR